MKNPLTHVISVFLLGTLVWLMPGCKPKDTTPPKPPSLKVMTIEGKVVPLSINMIGQAEGIPTVEIRARVEGYLENWSFEEGSIVRKGQVLFTIEKDQYVNSVNYAQADLERKEASWEYAKLNAARLEPLVQTSAISQNDYDVAVTREKEAQAAVLSAEADLAQAKLNLSYTTMISPITGYIGAVEVRPGNLVGRGESTLLATVSNMDPIYINFQMNESDYLWFVRWVLNHKEELHGDINIEDNKNLPVFLVLSDGKPFMHKGYIDFVGRAVDPATGTLTLRAVFPNKEGMIKPGAFSEVTLLFGKQDNGILIPQSSLQPIQDKEFVFIVDSTNKIRRISVILGQYLNNNVVVQKGLKIGDRILLEGYQKIKEGMEITPVPVPDTLTVKTIFQE